MVDLYLDIETRAVPGLSWDRQYITVVGFFHKETGLRQIIWPHLSGAALKAALPAAERIFTYNGEGFDLKVIRRQLGLNLLDYYKSHDLMFDCWSKGLKGGLKAVEHRLGIGRAVEPLSNRELQRCWTLWKHRQNEAALKHLLAYNGDDVMNLVALRERLEV